MRSARRQSPGPRIAEITAAGFDEREVRRVAGMVLASEFKRRQGAPGVKFDVEGSGYGFRVIRNLTPQQAEMPHTCTMGRP